MAAPEKREAAREYARNRDAVYRQNERKARAERAGKVYRTAEQVAAEREARRVDREAKAAKAKRQREARRAEVLKLKPWLKGGLTDAERWSIRYRLDPDFNIRERARAAMRRTRQGIRVGKVIRSAVTRNGAAPSIEGLLGYTIAELRTHLERQFDKKMDWGRFCNGEIHIDHIVPLSSFDCSDPNELRAAWSMTNLRPMWAGDNIAKGASVVTFI